MNSYIELAYKISSRSKHKQHHLACVIIRGGSVLSMAANLNEWNKCSERRALKKHMDFNGASLIVVRSNKKMSKPCIKCQKAIKRAGIKKVIYIDWDGNIKVEKVSSWL